MAAPLHVLFDLVGATTVRGKLLALLLVSFVCGVLTAGLTIPAVTVVRTTMSTSVSLVDGMTTGSRIDAPAQVTRVLAADESVIAGFYAQNRVQVVLDQMSPFIAVGIVSIEDARFYDHGGIDPTSILRALAATVQCGRQGASTITEQYVNNAIIEAQVSGGNTERSNSVRPKRLLTKSGK